MLDNIIPIDTDTIALCNVYFDKIVFHLQLPGNWCFVQRMFSRKFLKDAEKRGDWASSRGRLLSSYRHQSKMVIDWKRFEDTFHTMENP